MIALDTNLLVHAHRRDLSFHAPCAALVKAKAEGSEPWAIPLQCLHEFYAVVTRPRYWVQPTTGAEAWAQIAAWRGSPSLVVLCETATELDRLRALCESGAVVGPRVHDGRIAALCLGHGIEELWSFDRDFSRFPGLSVRNPVAHGASQQSPLSQS